MRPQLSPLPGASSKSKTAGRPPPPPPPHPANPVPQICTCICNHRILPTTTSANPDPLVKFVCVCFGGAIQISKFSPNPMTLRKKFSKMISWLGGCLPCSNCATHVSCFSSTNHDNPVVTINYYGNTPREGESSGHGSQLEGGSQGRGSQQDALPDLISM